VSQKDELTYIVMQFSILAVAFHEITRIEGLVLVTEWSSKHGYMAL
jgi:hypothetical protein